MNKPTSQHQSRNQYRFAQFIIDALMMILALIVSVPIAVFIHTSLIAPYLFGIGQ